VVAVPETCPSPVDQENWDRLSDKTVQALRCLRKRRDRIGFALRGAAALGMAWAASYVAYRVFFIGQPADGVKTAIEAMTPIMTFAGAQFGFSGKIQSCDLKLRRVEHAALNGDAASLLKAIAGLGCYRHAFDEVYDDARRLRRQLIT
jgi:hypothetical protein